MSLGWDESPDLTASFFFFSSLKKELTKMENFKRHGIIMFDEMRVRKSKRQFPYNDVCKAFQKQALQKLKSSLMMPWFSCTAPSAIAMCNLSGCSQQKMQPKAPLSHTVARPKLLCCSKKPRQRFMALSVERIFETFDY